MPATSTVPARQKIVFTLRGKLEDIIAAIMYADMRSAQYVEDIASELRSSTDRETAYNVWKHWKDNVPYNEDPAGKQDVQSPGEVWRNRYADLCEAGKCGTGKGCDCKSYSIACGAIFQCLGIPYVYRFISESDAELHHVYLVVDGDIIVDCVNDEFDEEVPHVQQVDMKPPSAGIGAPAAENTGVILTTSTDLSTTSSLDENPGTGTKIVGTLSGLYLLYKIIF